MTHDKVQLTTLVVSITSFPFNFFYTIFKIFFFKKKAPFFLSTKHLHKFLRTLSWMFRNFYGNKK